MEIELLPEAHASGILRPPSARVQKVPHKTATVLKVHPDFRDEHDIGPGDRVLLGNFVGEAWLDGAPGRVCILRDKYVLCKLD